LNHLQRRVGRGLKGQKKPKKMGFVETSKCAVEKSKQGRMPLKVFGWSGVRVLGKRHNGKYPEQARKIKN